MKYIMWFLIVTLIATGGFLIRFGFKKETISNSFSGETNRWYTQNVSVTWINDPIEVSRKLNEQNELNDYDGYTEYLRGVMSGDYDECTIWAYEPRDRQDSEYLETLGHEVLHCFRGAFHLEDEYTWDIDRSEGIMIGGMEFKIPTTSTNCINFKNEETEEIDPEPCFIEITIIDEDELLYD